MAQKPQIIDITKSYLPGDPNSFVHNLVNTDKEDGEEKTLPILAYEGYNFLPTSYGYKSYFGTNYKLNIDKLNSRAQWILLYQLPNFQSRLIALCEDGIWICNANIANSQWQQVVTFYNSSSSPYYNSSVFEEWTWCVIENVLYMYQQGRSTAWKTSVGTATYGIWSIGGSEFLGGVSSLLGNNASNWGSFESWEQDYITSSPTIDLVIVEHIPNFLNMSGQMGIFKAGTRLGFWDSANSVSWSSNLDLTDFTPSLENLAGNTIFGAVVGRIVTIKSHGEGFVIYSTKSIVGVTFSIQGNLLWDGKTILDNTGIRYSKSVCFGKSDSEHFIFSTSGIFQLGNYMSITGKYEVSPSFPELYDLLRESRDPIALVMLENRYLCFDLVEDDYINGKVSFLSNNIDPLTANIKLSEGYWTGDLSDLAPTTSNQLYTIFDVIMKGNTGAAKLFGRYWRPRWNCTFQDMQLFAYTHMYSGILYFDFGYPFTPVATDPITTSPVELTSTILTAHEPPIVSGKYGNPFTLTDCFPDKDFYSSNTSLSIFYKQELEWEEFQANQTATKNRILAWGTPFTNTPGYSEGSVIGYLISGKGPVKLKYEQYTTTLRKYFTERYKITAAMVANQLGVNSGSTGWTNVYPTSVVINPVVSGIKTFKAWLTYLINANIAELGTYDFDTYDVTTTYGNHFVATFPKPISAVALIAAMESYRSAHEPITVSKIMTVRLTDSFFAYNKYLYVDFTVASYTRITTYIRWDKVLPEPTRYGEATTVDNTIFASTGDASYNCAISTETGEFGYSDLTATQTHWDLLDNVGVVVASLPVDAPASAFSAAVYPDMTGLSLAATHPEIYWHVEDSKGNVVKGLSPINTYAGTFGQYPVETGYGTYNPSSVDGYTLGGTYILPVTLTVTYPGSSFILQTGSISTFYQDFVGALVLDTQLKKWGKYKGEHKLLLDTQPVNAEESSTVSYTSLGIEAAILNPSGEVIPFDSIPDDSWIRYGKIGFYRLGFLNAHEVKVDFRSGSTGSIIVESSLDGKTLEPSITQSEIFTDTYQHVFYTDISARWHTVKISGNYDLTGLEVRGTLAGRR